MPISFRKGEMQGIVHRRVLSGVLPPGNARQGILSLRRLTEIHHRGGASCQSSLGAGIEIIRNGDIAEAAKMDMAVYAAGYNILTRCIDHLAAGIQRAFRRQDCLDLAVFQKQCRLDDRGLRHDLAVDDRGFQAAALLDLF